MTHDDDEASEDPTAERAAKGLLTGWIVAKTTPWLVRIAIWGAWLAAVGAYGGYVWWRVRRMMRAQGVTNLGEWLHRPDPSR